jgi:hypothetical protein
MWRSLASSDLAEVGLQRMSASYACIWRNALSGSPVVGLALCFRFLLVMQTGSTWKQKTFHSQRRVSGWIVGYKETYYICTFKKW